ncbi:hypothetical protein Y032_0123g1136 [Ancylostoma ceylanicum]|uniref:Uncharacterized protein n=1 Tax=Ancylostoma ceylanicum TaxID=53326 RepID=A0A016T9H2_9BILA|nr:hypothetical protein Y032_0123g1136 [Ancylostoma ceylanicum]
MPNISAISGQDGIGGGERTHVSLTGHTRSNLLSARIWNGVGLRRKHRFVLTSRTSLSLLVSLIFSQEEWKLS